MTTALTDSLKAKSEDEIERQNVSDHGKLLSFKLFNFMIESERKHSEEVFQCPIDFFKLSMGALRKY